MGVKTVEIWKEKIKKNKKNKNANTEEQSQKKGVKKNMPIINWKENIINTQIEY